MMDPVSILKNFANAQCRAYGAVVGLCLVCMAMAPDGHTQETVAEKPAKPSFSQVSSGLVSETQALVSRVAGRLKKPCAMDGVSYAHGREWTESCGAGAVGSITKVCVHGAAAVKSTSCQRDPNMCSGRASGEVWSGACGGALTGTVTYKCSSGNTVIDSSDCKLPYTCVDASTYNVACPAGMSGAITYTCNRNALSLTKSTCVTITNKCGTHAHGESWSVSWCPGGLSGSVGYTCLNGTAAITSMNCSVISGVACGAHADGATWTALCPDAYVGTIRYKCFNGVAGIKKMSCAAASTSLSSFNRQEVINAAVQAWGGMADIHGVNTQQEAADAVCTQATGQKSWALGWGVFNFSDPHNDTVLTWWNGGFTAANAKKLKGSNGTYMDNVSCATNKNVKFSQ